MTSEMQMHGMIPPAMELLSYQSKHHTLVQDADEEGIHGGNWRGYGAVGVGDADSRHQNLLWATPISGLNQQPYNHMHGGSSSSSENHSKLGLSESQDGRHEYMLNSRYHHPQDMLQGIGVSSNSFETGGGNSSLPYSIQLNPSAQVLRDPGSRWQGDFSNNIGGYGYNNNWVSRHQGLGYQTRDGSSQRLALSLSSSYNPSAATDIHMAGQANLLGMEADTRRRSTDPHHVLLGLDGFNRGKQVASLGTGSHSMFSSYGNTLKNSVYLKAAEELLCEFCNVGRESKSHHDGKRKTTMTDSVDFKGKTAVENQELFVGDRYELQRRKVKLVTMLEEVEIRYKNYRSEMHMVIASFESVTAVGSAAPYTSLALKAMSKHFRCLRDAITGQLEFTIKLLGEKESVVPGTSRGETPRLGLIERTLRQQRAYQQLGTLEQHPWRPQRGLPERSVSILRAWLFEHFLHPYPTDGDKHILAKQTGLTRSQVSNWFINARVRLWKPMVEEMYIEELKEEKDRSQNNNDEQKPYNEKDADTAATSAKTTKQDKTPFMAAAEPSQAGAGSSISQPQTHNSSAQLENVSLNLQTFQGYKAPEGIAIEQSDSININQGSSSSYSMFERNTAISSKNLMTAPSLVTTARIPTADIDPDFSAYSAETLTNTPRRYGASNGVSLTLGLRHSGLSYPLSEPVKYSNNNIYLARQHSEEDHAATQYNILPHDEETQASELLEQDLQQQYRHYVSGNRLLHDFVQG